MRLFLSTTLVLLAVTTHVLAQSCAVDSALVEQNIAELEASYPGVLSDISCDQPAIAAHQIMCASAESQDDLLWRMGRLNDLAWVYAVENATKNRYDFDNPPEPNPGFVATRDACTDAACLCAALIDETNGSLGGLSPYPR
jgi:hypothetical protein